MVAAQKIMITILGSINVDIVFRMSHLPAPGETVLCPRYETVAGGKGANQALAAARAGGDVAFVGSVGRDGFAEIALKDLKEGDTILKYGHDIGKVVKAIKKGEHVHVHNVKTKKW